MRPLRLVCLGCCGLNGYVIGWGLQTHAWLSVGIGAFSGVMAACYALPDYPC